MLKTLIIFDVDGTLLYSNKIDSQIFSDSYEAVFSRPFPSIDWTTFPHVTDHTIFSTAFKNQFERDFTESEMLHFQADFVQRMKDWRAKTPDRFREVPKSKETIDKLLQEDNFVLGIATGGWKKPATFKLDHLNINYAPIFDSYADNKVTREDIINESIENARKVHSDIGRVVYVGDAIWDVKTTRNMQLPLIGIRQRGDHHVLREAGATHILQNYEDYDAFVEMVHTAGVPVGV